MYVSDLICTLFAYIKISIYRDKLYKGIEQNSQLICIMESSTVQYILIRTKEQYGRIGEKGIGKTNFVHLFTSTSIFPLRLYFDILHRSTMSDY